MIADMPSHYKMTLTSGYCCEQCLWLEDEALNAKWEEVEQGDD